MYSYMNVKMENYEHKNRARQWDEATPWRNFENCERLRKNWLNSSEKASTGQEISI
jgi:hypothetical protein